MQFPRFFTTSFSSYLAGFSILGNWFCWVVNQLHAKLCWWDSICVYIVECKRSSFKKQNVFECFFYELCIFSCRLCWVLRSVLFCKTFIKIILLFLISGSMLVQSTKNIKHGSFFLWRWCLFICYTFLAWLQCVIW